LAIIISISIVILVALIIGLIVGLSESTTTTSGAIASNGK
jgi:hypothetical protein